MLPVEPPVAPMLAKLAHELPTGPDLVYEPKWDGFRCLAFCTGDDIDLRSRNDRPLARYFPEVVSALRSLPEPAVLDGELVLTVGDRSDFAGLMARLHPAASRVALLARESPASFVGFDLLAAGADDLLAAPFSERRRRLEALLDGVPPAIVLTPSTADLAGARAWLEAAPGSVIDGVMAKPAGGRYEPGRRAQVKVKLERTVECVVAGFRLFAGEPVVGSLLLGLYDGDELRHVGVATGFTQVRRRELVDALAPLAAPLADHPWRHGFALEGGPMGRLRGAAARWAPDMPLDWVPLRIEAVGEFTYTQIDGARLRHPAHFVRWRPDRDPASCRIDQLLGEVAA